jgi:hypothetical protein
MGEDENWLLCHSYICPFLKIHILSLTDLVNVLKGFENVDERKALNVAAKYACEPGFQYWLMQTAVLLNHPPGPNSPKKNLGGGFTSQ